MASIFANKLAGVKLLYIVENSTATPALWCFSSLLLLSIAALWLFYEYIPYLSEVERLTKLSTHEMLLENKSLPQTTIGKSRRRIVATMFFYLSAWSANTEVPRLLFDIDNLSLISDYPKIIATYIFFAIVCVLTIFIMEFPLVLKWISGINNYIKQKSDQPI